MRKVRILVVGCGSMGISHAKAYYAMADFEIVGIVSRGAENRRRLSAALNDEFPEYDDFYNALEATQPDAVSINTFPDTHVEFTLRALDSGAHVFVEKPLAETVEEGEEIAEKVKKTGKKVVVGYILRHHPSWAKFAEIARTLGKPLVMRMNLNQQSDGAKWEGHKNLMASMSPIVDCGVHYVDMMCQMCKASPSRVNAMGARLTEEIDPEMYNYGQLQVVFEDGSVGWYEAGWGPMMSETAFFIKDVVGPKGCVSIMTPENKTGSADIEAHTKTNQLLIHSSERKKDGTFAQEDETLDMKDEPGHDELCSREQEYFLRAIKEDLDITPHIQDAVNSLRIVLAADESVKTGQTVTL